MYYALIFFKQNLIYKNTHIHTYMHTYNNNTTPTPINQPKQTNWKNHKKKKKFYPSINYYTTHTLSGVFKKSYKRCLINLLKHF